MANYRIHQMNRQLGQAEERLAWYGGASCAGDIAAAAKGGADAVAVGSILHYGKTDVPTLKSEVRALGVEVRR